MKRFAIVVTLLALLCSVQVAWSVDPVAEIRTERALKNRDLKTSETSPFAAIGQIVFDPKRPARVALVKDTLLLNHPTADIGIPQLEISLEPRYGNQVFARMPMSGQFTLNNVAIGPVPTSLPSGYVIKAERFRLVAYYNERGGRLMAFDTESPVQKAFERLSYFNPSVDWVVDAAVERYETPETVEMVTSLGLMKEYQRYARLTFTLNGEEFSLTLFASGEHGFLPFTDATNSEETYAGGRYLDLPLPGEGETRVQLDFNRAYNPYCAYTEYYNCPVPPEENDLPIHVEAGEKYAR